MPIEGYDFLEGEVEELFNRDEDIDIDEFVFPSEYETTIQYVLQDFNVLKYRYQYALKENNKEEMNWCVLKGCLLISGLLLYEFEE